MAATRLAGNVAKSQYSVKFSPASLARPIRSWTRSFSVRFGVGALEDRRWQLTRELTELKGRLSALKQRSNWPAIPDDLDTVDHVVTAEGR